MGDLSIPAEMIEEIYRHAEAEYPGECCGMIFGPRQGGPSLSRVRKCTNAQDLYHQRDPERFPRKAKTAYFIDPRELLAIEKELRANSEAIRIIYHSHIDTGAYFSKEDVAQAVVNSEPIYPGVQYLVLSVIEGKVADEKIFAWNPQARQYVE